MDYDVFGKMSTMELKRRRKLLKDIIEPVQEQELTLLVIEQQLDLRSKHARFIYQDI